MQRFAHHGLVRHTKLQFCMPDEAYGMKANVTKISAN